ncbi:selenide, water dikinase SelD, partial [Craurococcus roseus]|uniref:selenide, water dikinase SelD n=1 Tax=Craurococcus roseus TaxID=77585 RepID=UPI0031DEE89E
ATAVALLCRAARPLPRHAPAAGRQAERLLAQAGVAVRTGAEVSRVEEGAAVLAGSGERVGFDRAVWAGGSAPPAWLAETGLGLGPGGSLAVDDCLRTSDPRVFAAGDMAAALNHPRERAGVYAVRQGEPLLDNLRRVLDGRSPRPHRPQRAHLALLLAGERALAMRGGWSAGASRAALWFKDRIDRRWVEGFRMPPAMPRPAADAMRCGGCGAKVPPAVLSRVLARLPRSSGGDAVPLGLEAPDDAALLAPPAAPGRLLVQSVDHLRSFLGDPWRMGRVAAVHAMGDVAAMGGVPCAALAVAVLPPAGEAVLEADLHAMLLGGAEALAAEGARLAGGHSAEGAEAAIGFAVTGEVDAGRALRRSGLRAGDALLLTGPLGTGAILAAAMRGEARGRWLAGAVAAMERSPFPASRALLDHGATACADVTGFGLLGHLLEMLRASGVGALVDVGTVPALEGALEVLRGGVRSTLHPGNEAHARPDLDGADALSPERLALLLDPQTAGGLLAGVPAERAEACLASLRGAGDARAAVIGRVVPGEPRVQLATLRPDASLVAG